MTTSNNESTSLDTIKLVVALIILTIGVVAYYIYPEHGALYRVLYVVGAAIVAIGVFMTSFQGKNLRTFMKGSRTELRKVVWPNRQETLQTTIMVIFLVFVIAIFLFLVDLLLGWTVSGFITGGR